MTQPESYLGNACTKAAGWRLIFEDDFTKPAAVGSWATQDAGAVVYTGDHGGKWTTYPDGWSSTYTGGQPGYQPGQVLSVHDSVLDFYLHDVNGHPSGANPCPLLAAGSQYPKYQLYGKYSARIRTVAPIAGYHMAWLLWPSADSDWQYAESDFPETGLSGSGVSAFAHYGGSGNQDHFSKSLDLTQWHVYTQEWSPGERRFFVDGALIGTSTHSVFAKPERWQLQTEPNGGGGSGHLLVDWVAAWAYAP